MVGPAFLPKSPVKAGDVEVDGNDVLASFCRFPLAFNDNVKPGAGAVTAASIIVISRTDELNQEPT